MDFAGRVVVVTGASGGVGRATARCFAECGADVVLVARGETGLDAAAKEVAAAGGRALPMVADVADFAQVEQVAERAENELGPIDVWVNVAFSTVFAEFRDVTPEEFRRVTEVTYLGFVHGTKAALDRMMPRDRGVIVQTGSALAGRGVPLQSAYCGAKHAVQGFYESLRCELRHQGSGVQTTMVHLPAVNTPQFDWALSKLAKRPQPLPPIFQPEVAARALVHAAARPRREYWVGGSTVGTLVANRVVPGVVERYLARSGYRSQQRDEADAPERPGNLWDPADGRDGRDFGAHGPFGEDSKERSVQFWLSRHRREVGLATSAAAAFVAAAAVSRRGR